MPSNLYRLDDIKSIVLKELKDAELTKQIHSHDITSAAHREASKVAELCYKILQCYNPKVLCDY
jgi:hypothetical protein